MLAACGFHLQGRQPLPAQFAYTYVDTQDEQTDFVQDLRKALIASKVNVIRTKAHRPPSSRCTTTSSPSASCRCRRATFPPNTNSPTRVTFSVIVGGKTLIDKEEISATRDISFDEAQLLAKEREQEILRAALARDLVALVMRRLAAL